MASRKQRLVHITKVATSPGYEWANTRWLRQLVYEGGRLPSYRVAGKVLIDLDDLDDLVEQGRREPVAS